MRNERRRLLARPPNGVEETVSFLRNCAEAEEIVLPHVNEQSGSCVFTTKEMINNGRRALCDEHPAFCVDGTSCKTTDGWRLIMLMCCHKGSVFPVMMGLDVDETGSIFSLVLQAALDQSCCENAENVYIISDSGTAPNAAIANILPLCQPIHCWSHLTGDCYGPKRGGVAMRLVVRP